MVPNPKMENSLWLCYEMTIDFFDLVLGVVMPWLRILAFLALFCAIFAVWTASRDPWADPETLQVTHRIAPLASLRVNGRFPASEEGETFKPAMQASEPEAGSSVMEAMQEYLDTPTSTTVEAVEIERLRQEIPRETTRLSAEIESAARIAAAPPAPATQPSTSGAPREEPVIVQEEPVIVDAPEVTIASVGSSASEILVPTYLFAAPGQIEPADFHTFGVVAFPERPTPDTEFRFAMLCRAFIDNTSKATESAQSTPNVRQAVTVWPVENAVIADQLNDMTDTQEACEIAAEHYSLPHSDYFMAAARASGETLGVQRGPFLLAWRPGEAIGQVGVPVLDANLSLVVTEKQARDDFRDWKTKISHRCWECAGAVATFRRTLRVNSDYHGAQVVAVLKTFVFETFPDIAALIWDTQEIDHA